MDTTHERTAVPAGDQSPDHPDATATRAGPPVSLAPPPERRPATRDTGPLTTAILLGLVADSRAALRVARVAAAHSPRVTAASASDHTKVGSGSQPSWSARCRARACSPYQSSPVTLPGQQGCRQRGEQPELERGGVRAGRETVRNWSCLAGISCEPAADVPGANAPRLADHYRRPAVGSLSQRPGSSSTIGPPVPERGQ
jgi:hypothetical protein